MKRLIAPALVASMLAAPAMAQEAPKPGPEQARMGFFAGSWEFAGETKASPMGPAGQISGTETCEWFAGGFQLVCQSDMTGPRGSGKGGSIWAYDPARQDYTYYAYSSMGDSFYITGNVAGKVWTWNADFPIQGVSTKVRATITEDSATAYSYKMETSPDGTNWTLVEEGRATKKMP